MLDGLVLLWVLARLLTKSERDFEDTGLESADALDLHRVGAGTSRILGTLFERDRDLPLYPILEDLPLVLFVSATGCTFIPIDFRLKAPGDESAAECLSGNNFRSLPGDLPLLLPFRSLLSEELCLPGDDSLLNLPGDLPLMVELLLPLPSLL